MLPKNQLIQQKIDIRILCRMQVIHWYLINAALLFIMVFPCLAQPPVSIPVTVLDVNAGMLNEGNYFCFKDSRDLLWMTSYGGLHRFDGKTIKAFLPKSDDTTSIVGNEVVSFIHEDEDDNIWVGTDRALNCYVREKGEFEHFSFTENDEGEFKVQGIDASGNIWLTFNGYIYTFDKGTRQFNKKAKIDLNHLRGEVVLMTEFQLNKRNEVTRTFSYGSYLNDPSA